ncbi:MAG: hypothetical protein AMJ84_00235 [Acidithiobacillales bacterium SM23_46]|nr:MAG: hypothetical protein AMJ84_00235 [Acidithiobacillales bacterium SM23_46]KPL29016.1 MAG: hypothetical protein AMJ72_00215 [Acidithiobacillales bacterium SM1_46]
MKFRIVYNAWWMRRGWGMVFWSWMWFGLKESEVSDRHYRHELQHCYQVKRKGRLWFLISYALLWLRHGAFWGGYRNHPYEVEARQHQDNPLTAEEIAWRERRRITL